MFLKVCEKEWVQQILDFLPGNGLRIFLTSRKSKGNNLFLISLESFDRIFDRTFGRSLSLIKIKI